MSVTCGFYNSLNHDRKYYAESFSGLFDGLINDGVYASIGTSMVVLASSGMIVNVGIGMAWFNHTWTRNDAILPLTVPQSEVVLGRIDAIVLEVNATESVRTNTIKVVKGTPATSPAPPTMIETEFVHQHPLCYISVAAGATEIIQANITNKVGTVDCPFVTGLLQTFTTEGITAIIQAAWDAWFADVQAQLGGDVAGNLLNMINATDAILDAMGIRTTTPSGEYDLKLAQLADERLANSIIPVTGLTYNVNTASYLANAVMTNAGRIDIDGGYAYWKASAKSYNKMNLSTFEVTNVDMSAVMTQANDIILCIDENYIFWWREGTRSNTDANSTGYLKRTNHARTVTDTSALLTVGYFQSGGGLGDVYTWGPQGNASGHGSTFQTKECIFTSYVIPAGFVWENQSYPHQAICFKKSDLTLIYRNGNSFNYLPAASPCYDMDSVYMRQGSLSATYVQLKPTTWGIIPPTIDGQACTNLVEYAKLGNNQYLCSWYYNATQYWGILDNIPGNAITSTSKSSTQWFTAADYKCLDLITKQIMYNQSLVVTNGTKPTEIISPITQGFPAYGIPRHNGKPLFLSGTSFYTIPLNDYIVQRFVKR